LLSRVLSWERKKEGKRYKFTNRNRDKYKKEHHMHFRLRYMKTFVGYVDWDDKTKEQALLKIVNDYLAVYPSVIDPIEVHYHLNNTITQDLAQYELLEEFEICQLLKDLQDNL